MPTISEWILMGLLVICLILLLILLLRKQDNIKEDINNQINNSISMLTNIIIQNNDSLFKLQNDKIGLLISTLNEKVVDLSNNTITNSLNSEKRIIVIKEDLEKVVKELRDNVTNALGQLRLENEQKLDNIRNTIEKSVKSLQDENTKKLDQIKDVVDEKLQKTLEDRISKSFSLVNERLEQVYKGLGEMQNLANGVGDLKKVLSNVKTRGILGEIQLGNILEQILAPEQYETNIVTKQNSRCPVEYAIKLPGDGNKPVYLPIDAKFPLEDYQMVISAYDDGNAELVKNSLKALIIKIKSFAKDISEKYIDVPNTTDFAIMFLPIEGLYAEVVKSGVVEELQRQYKINVAGPTTMAALLNSLQMGFKTLAIQKRSGEVWKILGAVKTEFNNFADVLTSAQKKLNEASDNIDKLVGTRTRSIQKKLNDVTALPELETKVVLEEDID